MNDASWPSFIAAPFISPRIETIFSAVSRWRCSSFDCATSSLRPTLAARVPA